MEPQLHASLSRTLAPLLSNCLFELSFATNVLSHQVLCGHVIFLYLVVFFFFFLCIIFRYCHPSLFCVIIATRIWIVFALYLCIVRMPGVGLHTEDSVSTIERQLQYYQATQFWLILVQIYSWKNESSWLGAFSLLQEMPWSPCGLNSGTDFQWPGPRSQSPIFHLSIRTIFLLYRHQFHPSGESEQEIGYAKHSTSGVQFYFLFTVT